MIAGDQSLHIAYDDDDDDADDDDDDDDDDHRDPHHLLQAHWLIWEAYSGEFSYSGSLFG